MPEDLAQHVLGGVSCQREEQHEMVLEKVSSVRSAAGPLQVKVTYKSQAGQSTDKSMYTFTLEGSSAQALLDQLQRLNEALEHVVSITQESEHQC